MDQWLHNEILDGLSKLLCLRLQGTPPDDLIEGTAAAWYEAITDGRTFDVLVDAPRFRRAFLTLMATRESWPAPKHFIEALPRVEQAAIGYEAKPVSRDEAAKRMAEIRAEFERVDGKTAAAGSDA